MTGTCTLNSFLNWLVSEEASHLGDLLTGIAAMLAFISAFFAIPNEIRKWRKIKLLERKSEIAGKLAVATVRFAEALRYLANPLSLESPSITKDGTQAGLEIFDSKVKLIQPELKAFIDTWNEVEVYLSEDINEATKVLWDQWKEIELNFRMWFISASQNAAKERLEFHKEVYGKQRKEKINAAEKNLKILLAPIIRLEEALPKKK